MVPGEGDLALGLDWWAGVVEANKLPVVLANMSCEGIPAFPPGRRVERGGVTLGIVGVIDPKLAPGGCTATDPAAAAAAAFESLGEVDVRVVLAHQDGEADQALAEAVPQIDLVINGHARLTNTAPRVLPGDALQLAGGSRGRSVGVATVTLNPGGVGFSTGDAAKEIAENLDSTRTRLKSTQEKANKAEGTAAERYSKQVEFYEGQVKRLETELVAATAKRAGTTHGLQNEMVSLGTNVADEPAALALLDETKKAISALEISAGSASAEPAGQSPYVGATVCQGCHPGPYAQWAATPHAHAWKSLESANREMDRACYSCHATGVDEPGGPTSPTEVLGHGEMASLTNVQCESCHGPAREHVAAPGPRQLLPVPPASVCTRCHDGVRDEGRFDFEAYRPKVVHADTSARGGKATPAGAAKP